MTITLGEVATLVAGELHGDSSLPITGADSLHNARAGELTFVDSDRLAGKLAQSRASAVLTPADYCPEGKPYVAVPDVQAAFAKVVALLRPQAADRRVGIAASAYVSPTARIGPHVTIHPNAVIGEHVQIGAGTTIHAGVQIMAGCQIGERVVLFPNVVLYENTVLGDRSLIHAGAVIGAYGFGYTVVDGRHLRSAQLGNVRIGADVEIGSCTTVDRGTYGSTVIGDGTKIDNQVMIAHNCRIGRRNLIGSQVGVAGSTTTGDDVVIAGQAGVRDHVHIGDRATLGAKAGVMGDIPAGATYVGIPALPEREQTLIMAAQVKLPDLKRQLKALQRAVDQLTGVAASKDAG